MEKERRRRFKKGVNFLILVVLAAGVLSIGVIFASSTSIDSSALVTYGFFKKQVDQLKMYIDNKINELDKKIKDANVSAGQAQDISKLQSQVANLSSEIEKLKLQTAQLDAKLKDISSSSGVKKGDFIYTKGYEVIKVPKSKTILFDASTEFVVRVGKAISVVPKGATIIDLTSAKDVGANQQLLFNHFYLVARSDGRGFKAVDDVWVIVNGGYKIK